jgi:hypothetical protein
MTFMIKERLYHTADKSRLVRHNDPDAAYLAFVVGQELPEEEARRLGVLAFYAATDAAHGSTVKQGRTPVNKMAARPADKSDTLKEIVK